MINGLLVITFPRDGPVAGLVIKAGRVDRAPSITRYAIGWGEDRARRYFIGRGCTIDAIPDEVATA